MRPYLNANRFFTASYISVKLYSLNCLFLYLIKINANNLGKRYENLFFGLLLDVAAT